MSNPQFIYNENGEPIFVVLSIADYNAMINIPEKVKNIANEKDVSILAAWRIFNNFTQHDVERLSGISQANLSKMERKGTKSHKNTLEKLARIYNCSPNELL